MAPKQTTAAVEQELAPQSESHREQLELEHQAKSREQENLNAKLLEKNEALGKLQDEHKELCRRLAKGEQVSPHQNELKQRELQNEVSGLEQLAANCTAELQKIDAELAPLIRAEQARAEREKVTQLTAEFREADRAMNEALKNFEKCQAARFAAWKRWHEFKTEIEDRPRKAELLRRTGRHQ